MFARIQDRLKIVFATRRPVLIATSSATGLMEAAIRNAPPGRVLALVNGAFSERFANIAAACGRTVDRYEVLWGECTTRRRYQFGSTPAHTRSSRSCIRKRRPAH